VTPSRSFAGDSPSWTRPRLLMIFQPAVGGVPTYVADLVEALAARGWEVDVAAPDECPVSSRLQAAARRVIALNLRSRPEAADARAVASIARYVRRERIGLIHAHSSKAGAIGCAVSGLTGRPSIYTPHGWSFARELSGSARRRYVMIERLLARRHARIVTVSAAERALGLTERIAEASKIVAIPTGLPDRDASDSADERGQLGFSDDDFVVGWIGRLGRQKQAELLPDVAARISGYGRVLALGYGLAGSDVGRELELAGGRAVSDLPPEVVYGTANVQLLTSRWEGLPLVVLEAMRASRPCVAFAIPGIEELIEDGVTGFTVPPDDTAALVERIRRLAVDRSLGRDLGLAARERFETRFGLETMITSIERVYRSEADRR
jgi:glycosyltransferase involved in cell wall biosynthesis